MAPTQRTRPDGTPAPPFGKIDWLFARGLRCTDPAIIAAVAADGTAISDHEALAVTVAPLEERPVPYRPLAAEAGHIHVCAHRGHSVGAPENTLPALLAAAAARRHGLRDRHRPDAGR